MKPSGPSIISLCLVMVLPTADFHTRSAALRRSWPQRLRQGNSAKAFPRPDHPAPTARSRATPAYRAGSHRAICATTSERAPCPRAPLSGAPRLGDRGRSIVAVIETSKSDSSPISASRRYRRACRSPRPTVESHGCHWPCPRRRFFSIKNCPSRHADITADFSHFVTALSASSRAASARLIIRRRSLIFRSSSMSASVLCVAAPGGAVVDST